MKNKQPIVYCWRYENQPFCKIGKSFLEIVWNGRLKYAQSVNVLDIEVLGICRCDSELERDKLEKHLLNERFDKAHPDRRELVYFNSKVRNWIQHNYVENDWTIEALKEIDNPYAEKNRVRERERQRRKRREEDLKTRARNMYRKYAVEPKSPLCIGGPALARVLVAEDLATHGIEESTIQEWLDELENTC